MLITSSGSELRTEQNMSTANVETLQLPSYLGGEAIDSVDTLTVHYPYDGSIAGTVSKINGDHLDLVIGPHTVL